jgi:GINS complex subunit 3
MFSLIHLLTKIKEQSQLELPLWLAELLAISGITPDSPTSFVSLLSPDIFSNKVLNALKSDPRSVDLRSRCNVFFWLAERWIATFGDQELADTIVESLRTRAVEISDIAHSQRGPLGEASEIMMKLDDFEQTCRFLTINLVLVF